MVESIRPRPRAQELIGAASTPQSVDIAPSAAFYEAARRRLMAAILVATAALALYLILYVTVWAEENDPVRFGVNAVAMLLGVACALALRSGPATRGRLLAVGLAFLASLSCSISIIEALQVAPDERFARLISWNCANVLLVPVLVPVRSRHVLAITGAVASTTPIALLALPQLLGTPEASVGLVLSMSIPPFICAAIAYFPSTVLEGLHREVADAKRLGAYDLVERIGAGGMGEVWRATHRLLARPAAIKLVRADLRAGAGEERGRALSRFEREARVTAALESPHTIELYDFGVSEDGTLYYVMELLCGLDLETLVERFGPLPPERVVWLLAQVCDSLEEAHRAGLVHRDIKPANIFVSRRADLYDWIKVLDFGLVRGRERAPRVEGGLSITADGQIPGTPAYIAPEAAVGDVALDGRADLYALGCVAYFALTGAFVFDASSPMAMVVAHVTETPKPPSARLGSAVPGAVDDAVLACLAKSPAERPPSAKALAERLRAIPFDVPWTDDRAAQFWREHLSEHFHA